MKTPHIGVVTGLAVALPSSFILPAHAVDPCMMGGYTFAAISTSGFACQKGDKIYSDFTFSGAGFGPGSFTFTEPSLTAHSFGASGLLFGAGLTGSYSYKVAIDSAMSPNTRFYRFLTSTTTFPDFDTLITNTSKTLSNGTNTVTSSNGANSSIYTYSPIFPGPITFSSTISVTEGSLQNFTDTVTQMDVPPVPGPLPLLGAAAAFKVSRQLRKRSKQAA